MIQANPTPKISQKQSLALSNFLFSYRPDTTHKSHSTFTFGCQKTRSKLTLEISDQAD